MSPCESIPAETTLTAEEARTCVANALAVLEIGARMLEALPGPEAALEAGDRELFRHLLAAETALGWLVGKGEGSSWECPGGSSAYGDGLRIFCWSTEQTERRFQAALRDCRERVCAGRTK